MELNIREKAVIVARLSLCELFTALTGLRPRRLFEVLRNRGGGARPSELCSSNYFLLIFSGSLSQLISSSPNS